MWPSFRGECDPRPCFVIGDLADMAPKSAQVTSVCVVVWVGISWLLQNLGCCTVISSQNLWLVGGDWNMAFIFHILGIIIPTVMSCSFFHFVHCIPRVYVIPRVGGEIGMQHVGSMLLCQLSIVGHCCPLWNLPHGLKGEMGGSSKENI